MKNWKNISVAGGGIVAAVVAAVLAAFSTWKPEQQSQTVIVCVCVAGCVAIVYILTDRLLDMKHPRQ